MCIRDSFGAVQQAFSTQQTFDGSKFFCTLSCGCAFAPHDGTTYLGLLKCASSALDHAKRCLLYTSCRRAMCSAA